MESKFVSWDEIHKGTNAANSVSPEDSAADKAAAGVSPEQEAAGAATGQEAAGAATETAAAEASVDPAEKYKDLPVDEDGIRQFITKDMLIGDVIEIYPSAAKALLSVGMHCVTCGVALYESVEEASYVHGLDPDDVIKVVNDMLTTELIEHPGESAI